MGTRRTWLLGLAVSFTFGLLAISACVGGEPATTGPEDGAFDAATGGDSASSGDGSSQDGGASGPCSLAADFSMPVPVPGLDSIGSAARLSEDERTAYFAIYAADGGTQFLGQAKRATLADAFGAQERLPTAGAPLVGFHPSVSIDGKTLYFAASLADGGPDDIFAAQRLDPDASFGAGVPVSAVESTSRDEEPFIAFSGDLWFSSDRSTSKLHIYKAPHSPSGFGPPVQPANLNASDPEQDEYPLISHDGLTLYFSRSGPDTEEGSRDVWWTHRPDTSSDFAPPASLPNVNGADADRASWLSPDGCRLYIARGGATAGAPIRMVVASKPPN